MKLKGRTKTVNLKERAQTLKINLPAVFLALKKKETPLPAKLIAALTVGYALSPIDLIPDFIPFLGYLDDIMILPILIALTIKLIPQSVFEQCRIEAEGIWQNGKPKYWYLAIPILLIWFFLLWLIIKKIIM